MLDLTKAPPGIAEYAKGLPNLSGEDLWQRVWQAVAELAEGIVEPDVVWLLWADLEELRRRLSPWLKWIGGEVQPLPMFSREHCCAKCGAEAAHITTHYCRGWSDEKAVCWMRPEAEAEHMHRKCPECGYEWLEACATE
jgi:hypothetical protein